MGSQFRNLVFEGGGVKGIAYAGAVEVLENRKILGDIKRVAGTSAGAITAALLALGCDSRGVRRILAGTSFKSFLDHSFGLVRDGRRLVKEYGWYKGDAFEKWMGDCIDTLIGDRDCTFRTLHDKAQRISGLRSLYVVGTDLNAQDCKVYSNEHTPNMTIREAVRISMSIPLYFRAVKRNGRVLVDGGVSYNYPIDLFDERKYLDRARAGSKVDYPTAYAKDHIFNKETLGFRVDTADEIKSEKDNWRAPKRQIRNFGEYAGALIGFVLDMANKVHLHRNDWHRTVFIDGKGVGTTDFDISRSKLNMLVKSGKAGTQKYFQWFDRASGSDKPLNKV